MNLNLPVEIANDYSNDLTQMVVIDRRDGWTYPPPFPNPTRGRCGKGAVAQVTKCWSTRKHWAEQVQCFLLEKPSYFFNVLYTAQTPATQTIIFIATNISHIALETVVLPGSSTASLEF